MALPLASGHLLNATLLVMAAVVALAAERYSLGPAGLAAGAPAVEGVGALAEFAGAASRSTPLSRHDVTLRVDPFGGSQPASGANSVARPRNASTVSAGVGPRRQLTAILVANNRPVAVIDDEVVGVGDVLRDGARVSRVQSDRVFLIEKNGKWRTLTLAAGRP